MQRAPQHRAAPPRQTFRREGGQPPEAAALNPVWSRLATSVLGVRLQRTPSISNYSDAKDPSKDPGHIPDADIQATDEYKDLVAKYNVLPYPYNAADTVLACKLAIRSLRQGNSVNMKDKDTALRFLRLARDQDDTAAQTEKLENKLSWVPFNSGLAASNPGALDSEFAKWLLVTAATEPSSTTGKLNCWELVMFGAYQAGAISLQKLKAVYAKAVENVKNNVYPSVGNTFEETTKASSTLTFDLGNANSPVPLRGDIVVFKSAPVHACISTGKVVKNAATGADEHEVMSLWTPNGKKVERTTIEKLALLTTDRPILFWTAKWDGK